MTFARPTRLALRRSRLVAAGIGLLFAATACGGSTDVTDSARFVDVTPAGPIPTVVEPTPVQEGTAEQPADNASTTEEASLEEAPAVAVPVAAEPDTSSDISESAPTPVPPPVVADPTATPVPTPTPEADPPAAQVEPDQEEPEDEEEEPEAEQEEQVEEPEDEEEEPEAPAEPPMPSTERAARPDGDSEQNPIVTSMRGRPVMFSDAVSSGEDEADYYEFIFDGPRVESLEITVTCPEIESVGAGTSTDGQLIITKGPDWQDNDPSICGQFGSDNVTIRPPYQEGDPLRISVRAASPTPDVDVYVRYDLTVTPTFAEEFTYNKAPDDGDSSSNPVVVEAEARGLFGQVSAPDGDTEDWFVVIPTLDDFDGEESIAVTAMLVCDDARFADSSARAVFTLFDSSTTALDQITCDASQSSSSGSLVKLTVGETYFWQFEMVGTGSVDYSLTLET